jgi:MFS family permease
LWINLPQGQLLSQFIVHTLGKTPTIGKTLTFFSTGSKNSPLIHAAMRGRWPQKKEKGFSDGGCFTQRMDDELRGQLCIMSDTTYPESLPSCDKSMLNGKFSTLRALRIHAFRNIWLASLVSGTAVAAHDTAATWMMNTMSPSSFLISIMTSLASLPFFLFALPAGALADAFDKGLMLRITNLWLAACAVVLALLGWAGLLNPQLLLGGVFVLGFGFAVSAPIWTSLVPELVPDQDLPSATTLGGLQFNISGILGPALGGFLLSLFGAPFVFALNAVGFLVVAAAIRSPRITSVRIDRPFVHFARSVWMSAQNVKQNADLRRALSRNTIFSFFIALVPALTPVLILKELQLDGSTLGLVFASMGVGSVVGAILILPRLRERFTTNQLTVIAHTTLAGIYLLMALLHHTVFCLLIVALAGTGWTLAASELWVAAQRAIPDSARGSLSALTIVLGQGATAAGAIVWGLGGQQVGTRPTLFAAAVIYWITVVGARLFLKATSDRRAIDAGLAALSPTLVQTNGRAF